MGRRPDPLILDYFNRGEKLPDQSNRYSYTCKSCGAIFPKGRTNHLIDHLTGTASRCPAVTSEDLAKIVTVQTTKSADKARKEALKTTAQELKSPFEGNTQTNGLFSAEPLHTRLPLGQGKKLSGLEALAEASRQVERPSDPHDENGHTNEDSILDISSDTFIDPNLNSVGFHNSALPTSIQDLSSIAATASNLEASLLQLKKHFESPPKTPMTPKEEDESDLLHHASTWHVPIQPAPNHSADQLAKAATFPVRIAAGPAARLPGLEDVGAPPSKVTKTRSKFSESRRQEVQGVRQKRACIRCRMLRKPVLLQTIF